MMYVDTRQRVSTSVAAVVAAKYQVGNNHVFILFNSHFDDVNNDVNNDAEYH